MKNTKQFGFMLKNDLRERLEKRSNKFGTTLSHQINRAIEFQLNRDEETEKNLHYNNFIYGESKTPEDSIKEFVK